MKRHKLVALFKALNNVSGLKGVKFAYGVVKNLNKIRPEIEALQESVKPSKEYSEFEKKRIELAEKHADKDEQGKAKTDNEVYVGLEGNKKFEKEFETLKGNHKEILDTREKQLEEYNKMLDEEVKIELHKIKMEDLPENIETGQLNSIFAVIEDE